MTLTTPATPAAPQTHPSITDPQRLVAELVAWGALARESDGAYVVGRRLWDVGLLAPVNADLVETASPFLHDLYAATRATEFNNFINLNT